MTDAILDQLIDNQHIQGFVLEQDNPFAGPAIQDSGKRQPALIDPADFQAGGLNLIFVVQKFLFNGNQKLIFTNRNTGKPKTAPFHQALQAFGIPGIVAFEIIR